MPARKPAIAFWFRYGPAEHAELFHALPEVVKELSRHCEVHYFGFASRRDVPSAIRDNAIIHRLPFAVDRKSNSNKLMVLFLWFLCLPWIGIICRFRRIQAVYIDETLPFEALVARVCFGRNVAFTVADFFPEMYCGKSPLLRHLVRAIRAIDLESWRHLPLIFTRAKSTKAYLVRQGIPSAVVHPVYDPCDFSVYHPVDRLEARLAFGYTDDHLVLVHHGILHPNKGNDRILRALAELKADLPQIRYLLVGDGADMDFLKQLTVDLGLKDLVQFTGWLPQMAAVNQALNAGDIGLAMRIGQESDNFHMTGALVHNMACGLPVLAARLEGISEVVQENDAGLLFDPDNREEFKVKLLKLAGSPELRTRLGKRALELSHTLFDINKVTEAIVQPLLELCGLQTPSQRH